MRAGASVMIRVVALSSLRFEPIYDLVCLLVRQMFL